MENSNQKERLLQFIDFLGLKPHRFNVICGLSNSYTAVMRKGIGSKAIEKIAVAYPFLNTEWLLTGKGEMILDDANNIYVQRNNLCKQKVEKLKGTHDLQVYTLKCNGSFTEMPTHQVSLPETQDGDLCVVVPDDAMSPKYVPSSLLHIREVINWKQYLGYGYDFIFILDDGRRIFRRAEKADNEDYILCCSYNDNYNPENLPRELIKEVYRVVACLSFY